MEKKSIKQSVREVAEIISHTQNYQPLTPEEQQVLKKFFSQSDTDFQKTVELYFKTLLFFQKDSMYESNTSALSFAYDFEQICEALIGKSRFDSKYAGFSIRMDDYKEILISEAMSFLYVNNVKDFSMMVFHRINYFMKQLAKSNQFLFHLREFRQIEDKIYNGPVRESLLYSYVLSKRKNDKKSQYEKYDTEHYAILKCEKYFLEYAIKAIESGNINSIWEDDIINVIIQLRNLGEVANESFVKEYKSVLNAKIKEFIQKNISPEELEKARETLRSTTQKYKDEKLEDPAIQEEFFKAYQLVYVYELLTGKQRDEDAFSTDVDIFISRQFFSQGRKGQYIGIGMVLPRVFQDLVVKEYQRQKAQMGESKNNLLVLNNPDPYNDTAAGYSYSNLSIIASLIKVESYGDTGLIEIAAHEIDHQIKMDENDCVAFHNFSGYKAVKSQVLSHLSASVSIANYSNLYHEVSAKLAGKSAAIRAINSFGVGESPEKKDEVIERLVSAELKCLDSSIGSTIKSQTGKTWSEESDIKNYDRIIIEKQRILKIKYKNYWKVLQFEYKDDGKPKSLSEIIQDQEEELKSGVNNPDVGPKEDVERTKIRFQIMIERAMDIGKEEECLRLINAFILAHQDLFKDDPVLGKNYNSTNVTSEFDAQIRQYLREGSEEGIQNAEFTHRIKKLVERVNKKHRFSEGMFDCLFRKSINQEKSTPAEASKTSPNSPTNTSESPKTQPDDSTIQET